MGITIGLRRLGGAELGSLAALEAPTIDAEEAGNADWNEADFLDLDLDKAWHGIHYLLNRNKR